MTTDANEYYTTNFSALVPPLQRTAFEHGYRRKTFHDINVGRYAADLDQAIFSTFLMIIAQPQIAVRRLNLPVLLSLRVWSLLIQVAMWVLAGDFVMNISFAPVDKIHSVDGCDEHAFFNSSGGDFVELFNLVTQTETLSRTLLEYEPACLYDRYKEIMFELISRRYPDLVMYSIKAKKNPEKIARVMESFTASHRVKDEHSTRHSKQPVYFGLNLALSGQGSDPHTEAA